MVYKSVLKIRYVRDLSVTGELMHMLPAMYWIQLFCRNPRLILESFVLFDNGRIKRRCYFKPRLNSSCNVYTLKMLRSAKHLELYLTVRMFITLIYPYFVYWCIQFMRDVLNCKIYFYCFFFFYTQSCIRRSLV